MRTYLTTLFAILALVSCGDGGESSSSNTTGTFSATGMMSSTRSMPTANLLENGQVLVAGGVGSASIAVASADLYDPVTRTFSITGSMSNSRYAASSVRLLHVETQRQPCSITAQY